MKKIYLLSICFVLFNLSSYAGGACVATTNPSCATAVPLTVGGACINGTTCQGGAQGTSSCLYAGSQCSWYSFVATAANMFVFVDVTATDGCHISSNVYSSTGACAGLSEISCQSGTPLDDMYSFTTLTPGATYYIQVCYAPGGPCGNGGAATFCINADEPDPPCGICSTPCGTATGYSSAPASSTVVADCQTSPFVPALAASSVNTFCYSFQATATSVDFNVIITSNCSGGNVTNFSWSLYNSTCGGAIQTGTLASLTFTGLTVGNDYVFCYTFTVPSTCTHSQHCPYFVGATVLPIKLISFDASYNGKNVDLKWTTASEINNDYYTVERTTNGIDFEFVTTLKGAGNSSQILNYKTADAKPHYGLAYYRLKQTDFDGSFEYSELVAVSIVNNNENFIVYPNPIGNHAEISFNTDVSEEMVLKIMDITGRLVANQKVIAQKGMNSIKLDTEKFPEGIYFAILTSDYEVLKTKFVKK